MYCFNCGCKIERDWGYCSSCGNKNRGAEIYEKQSIHHYESEVIPNNNGALAISNRTRKKLSFDNKKDNAIMQFLEKALNMNKPIDKGAFLITYICVNTVIFLLLSVLSRSSTPGALTALIILLAAALYMLVISITGRRLTSINISSKYSFILCLTILLIGIPGVVFVGVFCCNNTVREKFIRIKRNRNDLDRNIFDEANSIEPVVFDSKALNYLDFLVSRVFVSCSNVNDLMLLTADHENVGSLKEFVRAADIQDLYILLKGFEHYFNMCRKEDRESFQSLRQLTLNELRNRNNNK